MSNLRIAEKGWGASYSNIFYMEVPKEILNEIADNLEAGFICYLHRDTFELVAIPDPDQHLYMEGDIWKEEMSKVRKNKKKFIVIEQMMPSDEFRVMADFVDSLPHNEIKIRLLTALEGQKPFANFKHQINNSGEYREQWFAFRRQKILEWIQNELRFEIH